MCGISGIYNCSDKDISPKKIIENIIKLQDRRGPDDRGIWESDLFVTTAPTAQFYSPDTVICPNNCATFYNTTPNLGLNWQWHFPGGTPSTSTDLNPTVCYTNLGNYNVSLSVTNPSGSDSTYASSYVKVQQAAGGSPAPLTESFESSSAIPIGWSVYNPDNAATWEHVQGIGGFSQSQASFQVDNFSTNFKGEPDYLVSPLMDFTSISNVQMTFDVAYAQWSVARSDTLSIYYSTDCGLTKNLLYQKSGSTLATRGNYPLYFTPTASEWRNDTVNLSPVAGLSAVEIWFENRSGNGNALYIDNINIFEPSGVGISELSEGEFKVYPNPFNDIVHVNASNNELINAIRIVNYIGQEVYNQKINNTTAELNLSELSEGMYIMLLETDTRISSMKIVK